MAKIECIQNKIYRRGNMSKSFIEIDTDTDWEKLCSKQTLSEDFIREFKDKVNWECISYHQTLSEDFIREFKDKVYWPGISCYQILSEDFIREFKDKITFSRPNIIFERDIEPFHPCVSGAKRYLKIWDKDQEITWNELIEKYDDKDDIWWLYNTHIKNCVHTK
jgi:hypothetical protein